ncbi:MAG: conjugative transposon protein TraJ [Alistipes sp.]|uniref:conjugative transposon protein TraJ n=1 Tax=Alistipes sp. TaxID=1872444 RepID=UPI0025C69827|nr:conjugative transposon protein TraJ [Alistipes sp.]MCD7796050.1 conjugative transposon protein TraJ [Alistipes sp.]MCD8273644.1 conjugative transposon protein TraJ [Alistipes sp.]
MVIPLTTFESLHELLRRLFEDMLPLCERLTSVASAIAGIGALLYISYRVWQAIARADAIDIFPLLRPFALCICIVFFRTLVLGGINGILSPVVKATHQIMEGQTFDMNRYQADKDKLNKENMLRDPETAYQVSDEEFDRQLDELGWSPQDMQVRSYMYQERTAFGIRGLLVKAFRWFLEFLFKTASLVIDTIRTFYLIVLAILGPLVFAVASFDGFQASLAQWFTKYISVYLWLPVSDLFGAILSRLQVLALQRDLEMMAADPYYYFNMDQTVYLVFMLIGICGYFTVPSVASWIVQAGGFNSYNRLITRGGSTIGGYVLGSAGRYLGNGARELFADENNPPFVDLRGGGPQGASSGQGTPRYPGLGNRT